jgi:hypothetical protein
VRRSCQQRGDRRQPGDSRQNATPHTPHPEHYRHLGAALQGKGDRSLAAVQNLVEKRRRKR